MFFMVWGKGNFKKEYLRLLPEVIETLEKEGIQKPENLESRSKEYERCCEYICNLRAKHPGDILKQYHLTEFLIYGLLKISEKAKDELKEVLYGELKNEDAKKLEAKFFEKSDEEGENYHRNLLVLLGRNSFLQLCCEYFWKESRERLRAEYFGKQRKKNEIKHKVRRFKKKRKLSG